MAEQQTIWVRSGRQDARVVLWERDERHPGAEAYVAASEGLGGQVDHLPVEVHRTPEVLRLLSAGQLQEVPKSEAERHLQARHLRLQAERAAAAPVVMAPAPGSMEDLEARLRQLEEARDREHKAADRVDRASEKIQSDTEGDDVPPDEREGGAVPQEQTNEPEHTTRSRADAAARKRDRVGGSGASASEVADALCDAEATSAGRPAAGGVAPEPAKGAG